MKKVRFHKTDGGAKIAGFSSTGSDCVYRALSTALELSYAELTRRLDKFIADTEVTRIVVHPDGSTSEFYPPRPRSSRSAGVHRSTWFAFLAKVGGWKYFSAPSICPFDLDRLPSKGTVVVNCGSHAFAVKDGVAWDSDKRDLPKLMVRGWWMRQKSAR